jgi:hypothetical protein
VSINVTPKAIRVANRQQQALCRAEVDRIKAVGERYINGRCVYPPQTVIATRRRTASERALRIARDQDELPTPLSCIESYWPSPTIAGRTAGENRRA